MKVKVDHINFDEPIVVEGTPTPTKQGTAIRFNLAEGQYQVVIETNEDELTEFA